MSRACRGYFFFSLSLHWMKHGHGFLVSFQSFRDKTRHFVTPRPRRQNDLTTYLGTYLSAVTRRSFLDLVLVLPVIYMCPPPTPQHPSHSLASSTLLAKLRHVPQTMYALGATEAESFVLCTCDGNDDGATLYIGRWGCARLKTWRIRGSVKF